jgi:hypothetical protein
LAGATAGGLALGSGVASAAESPWSERMSGWVHVKGLGLVGQWGAATGVMSAVGSECVLAGSLAGGRAVQWGWAEEQRWGGLKEEG